MTSDTTSRFWNAYADLPQQIKRQARKAYKLFERDPRHPSLQLKKVHADQPIYSVRITRDYRAVGVREGNSMIWFWIGSHADYERLLDQL